VGDDYLPPEWGPPNESWTCPPPEADEEAAGQAEMQAVLHLPRLTASFSAETCCDSDFWTLALAIHSRRTHSTPPLRALF